MPNPNPETNAIDFLQTVVDATKRHGMRKVRKKLDELSADLYSANRKKIIEYIFDIVKSHYAVTHEDVMNFEKRGYCTYARNMIIILIYFNMPNVKQVDIADMFNKTDFQSISRTIKKYGNNKAKKTKDRAYFDEDLKKFTKKVKTYINDNELVN